MDDDELGEAGFGGFGDGFGDGVGGDEEHTYDSHRGYDTLGESVLKSVEDSHFLFEDDGSKTRGPRERCTVCTMPIGQCIHTKTWMEDIDRRRRFLPYESVDVDEEMDDVLGLLNDDEVIVNHDDHEDDLEDVDIDKTSWGQLEQRDSDRIGMTDVKLFAPDERGWHSCVDVDGKYLVVFGGFRYKKKEVPLPFKSFPNPSEIEFLNDIRIYDVENVSWHGVLDLPAPAGRFNPSDLLHGSAGALGEKKVQPPPRYGHIAWYMGSNRMMIFGGRGERGRILNDTWIYFLLENRWELVSNNEEVNSPVPNPRFFSSCTGLSVRELSLSGVETVISVAYLFGGTNGQENFGDLWIFKGHEDINFMLWERIIAVGLPPCPRYGHSFVSCKPDGSILAVVGGCFVSAQGEMVGSNTLPDQVKKMQDLSNRLQKAYTKENELAQLAGDSIESHVNNMGLGVDCNGDSNTIPDIYRHAASMSTVFQAQEQTTRLLEKDLVDTHFMSKAVVTMNAKRARHPDPELDIVFLHTKELMWKSHLHPRIRGGWPSSRIHFGAACIGDNLILMGGNAPTGMNNTHVEEDQTKILVLDMQKWVWRRPLPLGSSEYLKEAIRIAESDIIRARKKMKDETSRALAVGAANGVTIELAEAQSIFEVCEWRRKVLLQEATDFSSPPGPRFGASLVRTGQRLIYTGGWNPGRAVPQGDVMVLNLEKEHARTRRLAQEHQAQIARAIAEKNFVQFVAQAQSRHELAEAKKSEYEKEEKEHKIMIFEDFRSSLPILSKPNPVRLIQANEHTMWVEWDAVKFNSKLQPVANPESVVYMLYMKKGFESILSGDRVSVVCEFKKIVSMDPKKKKKKKKEAIVEKDGKIKEGAYFDEGAPRFEGEVTKHHGNGTFDILFDDGLTEKNVPRYRIKLSKNDLPGALLQMVETHKFKETTAKLKKEEEEREKTAGKKKTKNPEDWGDEVPGFNTDDISIGDGGTISSTSTMSFNPVVKRRLQRKLNLQSKFVDAAYKLSLFTDTRPNEDLVKYNAFVLKNKEKFSRAEEKLAKKNNKSPFRVEDDYNVDDFFDEMDNMQYGSRPESSGSTFSSGMTTAADGRRYNRDLLQSGSPTVQGPSDWELVYCGGAQEAVFKDGMGPVPRKGKCQYTCPGLVARDTLCFEPGLIVPVAFILQTHGIDIPDYERSQLSEKSVFYTKNVNIVQERGAGDAIVVDDDGKSVDTTNTNTTSSTNTTSTSTNTINGFVSKAKKELFKAVINGNQMIQIEKRNSTYISQGAVVDEYM